MRDRNRVDPDVRGDGEELGTEERLGTVFRILCMRKYLIKGEYSEIVWST